MKMGIHGKITVSACHLRAESSNNGTSCHGRSSHLCRPKNSCLLEILKGVVESDMDRHLCLYTSEHEAICSRVAQLFSGQDQISNCDWYRLCALPFCTHPHGATPLLDIGHLGL